MSGLSNRRRTGEQARAALVTSLDGIHLNLVLEVCADRIIRKLQEKGYAIVSVRSEPTARRGKVYSGPAMIGQSHSARIVG